MMYAMCNLHDVSWGTKGDNGAAKDLGGAKKVTGEDMFEVEVSEDVDSEWEASRAALHKPPVEEKEGRDAATKRQDCDRNWVRWRPVRVFFYFYVWLTHGAFALPFCRGLTHSWRGSGPT